MFNTRTRKAIAVAALGLSLSFTAGCTYLNPVQTEAVYQQSDGTNGQVGNIDLRAMLVVSDGKDKAGALIGGIYNQGNEPERLNVKGTYQGKTAFTATIDAPAQKLLKVGYDGGPAVFLTSTPVVPGGMMEIEVTDSHGNATHFTLPVLGKTFKQYDDIKLEDVKTF